jgi:hypothetical protein
MRRYQTKEQPAAIPDSEERLVLATGRHVTGPEMGESFVRALPRMRSLARRIPRAFIARLSRAGAVDLIHRLAGLPSPASRLEGCASGGVCHATGMLGTVRGHSA